MNRVVEKRGGIDYYMTASGNEFQVGPVDPFKNKYWAHCRDNGEMLECTIQSVQSGAGQNVVKRLSANNLGQVVSALHEMR